MARKPLADRFWEKVTRGDDCWEWAAYRNEKGYGKIGAGGDTGPALFAHRVSWELAFGPIPDGLFVLHKCDNPPCVRPDHLFIGTKGDNFRDSLAKGRRPLGNPKLSTAQVIAIRSAAGTHDAIAAAFGVSRPTVSYIKNGKTWQHVT